jgi:hypothetical protein
MKRIMRFSPGKLLSTGFVMLAALTAVTPQIKGQSCTPPPSGIVGWWKGDGNAVDTVAGNNGVAVNSGYTNGVVGLAFSFDPENYSYGTYTGIEIPDQPAYVLTNSLSIEGWVRPRGNGGYVIFFRGDNRPGLDPYALSMGTDGIFHFTITDEGGNSATVQTPGTMNQWTHLAGTLDGSTGTMSLYTNGVLAVQTVTTIQPIGQLVPGDSPGIGIGNVNDGINNFPFQGDIDEIALYNRALSAGEVAAIYNAGSAGKCVPGETTNNCVVPPAGLISWWPAEGNANDVAGTNNGLLENVSFTNGMVGQAFYLNGSNADVQIPYSTSLQPASVTVEAWVKLDALASPVAAYPGLQYIVFKQNSRGGNFEGYDLEKNRINGQDVFRFQVTSAGGVQVPAASVTVPQPGTWYHLAGTYDSSSGYVNLYVNGVLEGSAYAGFPLDYGTLPVFIGTTGVAGWDGRVQGAVDEVSIYSRALSSNEIASIYNAGSAGKCPATTATSPGVPAISNFTPAGGANGTVVTISGTNFSAVAVSNIVYFGAVQASVSAASPTSLTVTVPAGATYAPITVAVGGLMAYANAPFLVTFAGGTNSSTALAPRLDLPAMDGPGVVAIADLDGDGRPDLLVASGDQGLSIYQNISSNGTITAASFAPPVNLPLPAGLQTMTVADVDGDGKLDIVVLNRNLNQVLILKNISTPGVLTTNSFAVPVVFPTGNDPRGVVVRDFDGDGLPDIAVANWADGTVFVYHNLGTSNGITTNSFAAPVIYTVGASPQDLKTADLDGDGLPDLVTANNNYGTTNSVSLLRNTSSPGNISFAPQVALTGLATAYGLAIGDLDGDGKPDLVVSSFDYGQSVSVYRNTSTPGSLTTNSFASDVDFALPGWGNGVAIGDLDGDGKPDLAVVTQLGDGLSLFKNISTPGSFTTNSLAPRVDYPTGWNPNGVAIGDLDGDGRPDIAFAVSYAATLSIYQNETPFGTAPPVITTQPTNLVVATGGTATFTVAAQGASPLNYQWSFNGTNLIGATNVSLALTNLQLNQTGNYAVLVTNLYGTAASSNALLTVFVPDAPPAILAQTPSQIVLLGSTASFSVTATGGEPLSYSWERNSALIPGATNFSYALDNAQLSDSGSTFNCLVTNAYGSATSTNATLKVIDSTIANDLCSGAIIITNASYTNVQSTAEATSFGDPVPDCVAGFGHGVWYQFTAPVAGLLSVDTFGSDFDTGLAFYTGSCDSLTEAACNDDTGGVTSQIILPTTAGTTYLILAGGYDSDAGNLVLHLNYFTPPAFVLQPTNISVIISSNGTFSTTLTGSLPMSFQWYFNNTPLVDGGGISGSTNSTLNIAGVQTNNGGNYFLIASNFVGVTTSSVAVLTPVILPPVFLQPPVSESVVQGANANFFAVVGGTPPYGFQWYFNGNPLADDGLHIAGSATDSLNISNLTTADAGSYSLTVTNVSGATNAAATLTVLVPPAITAQPVGRSVPAGLPTTFNAAASGIPSPVYQWQLNGTNLPGATGASYTAAAVGTNNLGFYQLVASNSVGVAVSADAQLTFGPVAAWGRNANNECLPPPGLSNVVGVAGADQTSFALTTGGTVVTWGGGIATNIPASASNVVAVSANALSANYALRSDGTVVSWDGLSAPPLSNIVSVAASLTSVIGSANFGCALRAEGTLINWGSIPAPGFPAGLSHLTAIVAGYNNEMALKSDGTVVVAGSGGVTNVPVGLSGVVAIAEGYTYAMTLQSNGTVVAWGGGTATNLPSGMTNIVAISAGNYAGENFGLALRSNGTVVAWGDNPYGETNPPAALTNLVSIAGAAAAYHGLALVNNGSPVIVQPPIGLTAYTGRSVTLQGVAAGAQPLSYQWLLNGTNVPGATNTSLVIPNVQAGSAGNYQLFVSNSLNTALSLAAPLTVITNNTLTFLAQPTGSQTNYQGSKVTLGVAVLGSGPLSYQWSYSSNNQIFTAIPGATNDSLVFNPALAVNSGYYYHCAVSNQFNSVTSSSLFLRVLFAKAWGYLATDPPFNVTNATAIAVGDIGQGSSGGEYLVLKSDGTVVSWSGGFVQFGETNVAALSNSIVTAIAAGYEDSLALTSEGTVYAWGDNAYGETNVPAGLSGVTAIACGDYHDLALKSDGTIVGWGQNTYLQTTNAAATNVVAIAAGGQDSMVLRADGSVVTWGFETVPVPLNVTNIVAIAAGGEHFLALRANGTVVGWGNDTYGQTAIPTNWINIVAISAGANHSVALRNDGTVLTLGEYDFSTSITAPSDLANVIAIAGSGDHDLGLFGTRAPAFTVQPWDRSVAFNTTTNIKLTGECSGVQPVSYQWQLNGTNLPGATSNSLLLTNRYNPVPAEALLVPAGAYQLLASNAYGLVASRYVKVTVTYPLGFAVNATNLTWTTSGDALWFGETNTTHDGVAAAQSGDIGQFQESILQTTVGTNVAGSYTFWWKVSSEPDFDFLEFRINGIVQTNISGNVDWQQVSIPVAAGTNVLLWRYYKDDTGATGQDAGWLDQFAFVAGPPVILSQPASQVVNLGATVSLAITASGVPQMKYQWSQNGNIVGGNSPVLTLNNVSRAQDGTYSVTVTNIGGSTVSSNAVVKVLVPQLLGTPQVLPNGSFQLTSTDVDGGLLQPSDLANFEAQASTDLVNWVTLPNVLSLTNGMLLLQDNSQSNLTARYYRIIEH